MRRRTIALAVAALVAAVVIYWLVRPGSDPKRDRDAERDRDRAATIDPDHPGRRAGPALARPGPGGAGVPGLATANGDRRVRTSVTDTGNLVRDHRAGVDHPVDVPAPLRPEDRTLDSAVSAEVYRKLAPHIAGCARKVAPSARGAEPVVYVTLVAGIRGGTLTTGDLLATTHDVDDDAAQQLIECVRRQTGTIEVTGVDQPDRDEYVLQYPVHLR